MSPQPAERVYEAMKMNLISRLFESSSIAPALIEAETEVNALIAVEVLKAIQASNGISIVLPGNNLLFGKTRYIPEDIRPDMHTLQELIDLGYVHKQQYSIADPHLNIGHSYQITEKGRAFLEENHELDYSPGKSY